MKETEILKRTYQHEGNIQRLKNIYITPQNMMHFLQDVIDSKIMPDILITPYLINLDEGSIYELHYYEFDIDIGEEESHYIEYNKKNCLPLEIIQNIKPRVIVADGDIAFYIEALSNYLTAMNKMKFAEDREHYPQLKTAPLLYEIFVNEDEV